MCVSWLNGEEWFLRLRLPWNDTARETFVSEESLNDGVGVSTSHFWCSSVLKAYIQKMVKVLKTVLLDIG